MTAFCLGVIVGVLLTLAYFGRFFMRIWRWLFGGY
jgi:uncharacterized membrane protein